MVLAVADVRLSGVIVADVAGTSGMLNANGLANPFETEPVRETLPNGVLIEVPPVFAVGCWDGCPEEPNVEGLYVGMLKAWRSTNDPEDDRECGYWLFGNIDSGPSGHDKRLADPVGNAETTAVGVLEFESKSDLSATLESSGNWGPSC
jgi:hypothetical protein